MWARTTQAVTNMHNFGQYNGVPVIELRKTLIKYGFRYEVIKDGEVIASRKSSNLYVAALIYKGDHRIASGVGRMDLLNNALKQRPCDYVALINRADAQDS